MNVIRPARSAQKLRIVRTPDGEVSGCLQCSVALDFGGHQSLILEDTLPNVMVGQVLNPLSGVFLADEVQRLMRIGAYEWLVEGLGAARMECLRPSLDSDWRVSFLLPLESGAEGELHIGVEAAASADQVRGRALEQLTSWRGRLNSSPLDEELLAVLTELDLGAAPYLRRGLAIIHPRDGYLPPI